LATPPELWGAIDGRVVGPLPPWDEATWVLRDAILLMYLGCDKAGPLRVVFPYF
jgi:hypothetical protein